MFAGGGGRGVPGIAWLGWCGLAFSAPAAAGTSGRCRVGTSLSVPDGRLPAKGSAYVALRDVPGGFRLLDASGPATPAAYQSAHAAALFRFFDCELAFDPTEVRSGDGPVGGGTCYMVSPHLLGVPCHLPQA